MGLLMGTIALVAMSIRDPCVWDFLSYRYVWKRLSRDVSQESTLNLRDIITVLNEHESI